MVQNEVCGNKEGTSLYKQTRNTFHTYHSNYSTAGSEISQTKQNDHLHEAQVPMNLITKLIAQCAMTSVFSSVAYDRISPVRIPPSLLSGTALTPRLPILIIHTFFFYDSPIKRVVVKKAAFFGQAAVRGERGQLPRP